jgi:protease-4
MYVVKSAEHKDSGSPWRPLTDEEKKQFQDMIDSMYERFLQVVLSARGPKGMTREKLKTIADGRVFEGKQAAELGLIDGVMYIDDVVARAKELGGVEDANVVTYEYPYSYRGNIYARSTVGRPSFGGFSGDVNLMNFNLGLERLLQPGARFNYLWLP